MWSPLSKSIIIEDIEFVSPSNPNGGGPVASRPPRRVWRVSSTKEPIKEAPKQRASMRGESIYPNARDLESTDNEPAPPSLPQSAPS